MTLRATSGGSNPGNFSTAFTNTGTIGAVTINQPSGRINIAAGQQNVVITNNLVTTNTRVFCNISSPNVDGTATVANADCTVSGQITVRLNQACTTQRAVDFLIVN